MGEIDVEVWEPVGHADSTLPLLLVHDGAEMDAYGGVVRYAATRPPMRVALLSPGSHRDERYAANPAYAAALVDEVLPAITNVFETMHRPVLLGQSLGGLAALHAAWTAPGIFAGLMLQSGSFFTPLLDPQESDYAHFAQVTGFVATVLAAEQAAPRPPEVTMTCGTAEENLANNLALRDHLRERRDERLVGRGPAGPHVDVLAGHPRSPPRRPAHRRCGADGAAPGRARRPRLRPGPAR